MTTLPTCVGIIPARYNAKRFPGKPLVSILGKPMIWHVYQRAVRCRELERVVVATDDERIRYSSEALNIPVMMTCPDHATGTDRVLEAAQTMKLAAETVVVNIQGDEPAIEPDMISQLVQPFSDARVQVTTMARKIGAEDARNPDRVKVTLSRDNDALYFSRSLIPYHRDAQQQTYLHHIGMYAFRMHVLETFTTLSQSTLEKAEKLEQLRLLENGIPIRVVLTEHESVGVDRPEDVATITGYLAGKPGNTHVGDTP
ncbi:MAG: 3-deoxy-manno-octulosonate cytidylyltransferase [Desulfobacteraceae bacterium]|nr:3-deoxy-manno-octulosonate cytidylyltransferase [Desulfobacteraceae bacterium]